MKPTQGNTALLLRILQRGEMPSPSPAVLDACLKVHDELEQAALANNLSDQHGKLLEAITGFIRSAPAIEVLGEIAMAIAYDVAIAQGNRGIVVELAAAKKVSRGHADRQIKRGRVLMAFQRAGKIGLMPTGRKIEMLAKLPQEHWIPAWEFVVQRGGKSDKIGDREVDIGLGIYKFKHTLQVEQLELLPPATEEKTGEQGHSSSKKPRLVHTLSPQVGVMLLPCLARHARANLAAIVRRGDPADITMGILLRMVRKTPSKEADRIEDLFRFLHNEDADFADKLAQRGRVLLLHELSGCVEQYSRQLQQAASRYRKKRVSGESVVVDGEFGTDKEETEGQGRAL